MKRAAIELSTNSTTDNLVLPIVCEYLARHKECLREKDTAHFATQSPKKTAASLYKYKSPNAENTD